MVPGSLRAACRWLFLAHALAVVLCGARPVDAQSSTNGLTYHGGPVMTSFTAYTIFWAPPGYDIPASYQTLINRWFDDVGGSSLLDVLTQYYQNDPPSFPHATPQNAATRGGSWVDTTNPYPHAGTAADPLLDADIQAEVARAISANNWPNGGLGVEFFVYTAFGIESCAQPTFCTLGVASSAHYCAYHSARVDTSAPIIYANMPYVATWNCPAEFAIMASPNDDLDADKEVKITSHEQFESITDPLLDAWYDSTGEEIADKCQYTYGKVAADGRNVTLNGNPYVVQEEWSNLAFNGTANSGCAMTACAPTPEPACIKPTQPGAAAVQLKANANPKKDALSWSWAKGATDDFGDPTSDTSYALCIYDESAGVPGLAMAVLAPVGSHWSAAAKNHGFAYSDTRLSSDGIKHVSLGIGPAGTPKLSVTGKGVNLPLLVLPLSQNPAVIVQLVNSAGSCWEADYGTPATTNTAAQFKAKSD